MTTEREALQALLRDTAVHPPALPYGPHPDQVVEFYGCAPKDHDAAMLVVVHGGYFRPGIDRTHARPMARALARAGFAVALAEYRRVSGEPQTCMQDLALLTTFLAAHRVLGWVGHSAGGTLVLARGCDASLPPTRVVALAPVADLRRAAVEPGDGRDAVPRWLGGAPQEVPERYDRVDPVTLLARFPPAGDCLALVHGSDDATVPVGHSTDLGPPVRVLPGAHHFDLIDPGSVWWTTVVAAISEHVETG